MRDSVKRFLLPDAEVSVKVIFDNVRNYLVCAGFLALALWFDRGAPGIPSFAAGAQFHTVTGFMSMLSTVVGSALFLVNLGQSFQIMQRALDSSWELFARIGFRANAHPGHFVSIVGLLLLLALVIAYALLLVALFVATLLAIIYLAIFSVTGLRAF